jgi:iron complex transport system ATP-binding protein
MINLQNVQVVRGSKTILHDINLQFTSQDRIAIIGPNGAGKSFLLRILSADLVPSYGSYVEIFGQVFGRTKLADLRRQIGFVATRQTYWFDSKDTLRQVVASGLDGVYGASREFTPEEEELIDLSLDKFRLTEIQAQPFEVLSDGEKRKGLLARGLVHQPRLLILDEPAIGLDIRSRQNLLKTVDELSGKLPLVYVTHNLEELPDSINQVVLLKEGRVFRHGPKAEVMTTENFSSLFETELELVQRRNKYYLVR